MSSLCLLSPAPLSSARAVSAGNAVEGRAGLTRQPRALCWELWGAHGCGRRSAAVCSAAAHPRPLAGVPLGPVVSRGTGWGVRALQAAKQSHSRGRVVKFSFYQISDHFLGLGTSNTSCSFATCPHGCYGYMVSPIIVGLLFSAWQGGGL